MTRDGPGKRGRTRAGRLGLLDDWILREEPALLASVVDLGLGDSPETTLELAGIAGRLIAVDHDPLRVGVARRAGLDARIGGFDLPVDGPVSLIRAMNVLRGYRPEEVPAAHAALGAALVEGGLLVEGSSDATGAVLVAHLIRRAPSGLHREGLLMCTDFGRGFAPRLFRDWLPRDLRRRVTPGSALRDLFDRWTAAWEEVRGEGIRRPPEAFAASAARLDDLDARHAERGHVVWRPSGGVPV